MTEITYSMENGRYTLEAKGHAGYDKHGHDIICAAVSALLQMGWAGLKLSLIHISEPTRH